MWKRLKETHKPIVLYGTGNGAQMIAEELARREIPIAGIFASDGFVRSRSFLGYPVLSYSRAREVFGDMLVLLCFGSHLPEVIAGIQAIAAEQELYAPDFPVVGSGLFDQSYYEAHRSRLDTVRSMLADEQSRQVFDRVIAYKLSGDLSQLFACHTPEEENLALLNIGPEEVYLDLGAYTGDTIDSFLSCTASWRRIIAVEPEARNFRKLTQRAAGLPNCTLLNLAVSDGPGRVPFARGNGRGGAGNKGKCLEVPCDSVDNLFRRPDLTEPPTLIKFDLEGAESAALKGAAGIIAAHRPKLLISAYHRVEDLWSIPLQLAAIRDDYRICLRKSPCIPAWEVNYYMV